MPIDGFDTQISWSGFTKVTTKPRNFDGDAYTYATFQSDVKPARGEGKTIVVKSADVAVRLNARQSWAVDGKLTDDLLTHEQGHYNITALGAREFYTALLKLKAKDPKSLGDAIQDLNDKWEKKIDTLNKRYDEKTDHSKVKAEQEKWNKAIAAEKQKADGSLDNLPQ